MRGLPDYYFGSDLIENMNRDQRMAYLRFEAANDDPDTLPYFQQIVELVSLIRTAEAFGPKEDKNRAKTPETLEPETPIAYPAPPVAPATLTFASQLNAGQIALLAKHINQCGLFASQIGPNDLRAMFETENVRPLQVNNLKLLVYLFDELAANRYIARNWQAVVVAHHLFVSKHGKTSDDHDLRSARRRVYDDLEGKLPKNSKIIDDCIEELILLN